MLRLAGLYSLLQTVSIQKVDTDLIASLNILGYPKKMIPTLR